MNAIVYAGEPVLPVDDFVAVLKSSGLAARRPAEDRDRMARVLAGSSLIVTARTPDGRLIGVARALTDYAYCCYLADLAVDKAHQGRGIGKRLIAETRAAAGPETMCLLLSAPDAVPFYCALGMDRPDNAFLFKRER